MSTEQTAMWHPGNPCNAEMACEHCEGILRHEPWCFTRSAQVRYAYEIVLDAKKLTHGDRLILHALGVCWVNLACASACAKVEQPIH